MLTTERCIDPRPEIGKDLVQTPKSAARSASFSEDYVAAARHINP
jgi:hypothetical protein